MPILASIIEWFSAHALRLAIIGAFSMALGVVIYIKGQQSSAIQCAAANSKALVEEIGKHNENHEKIAKMSLSDVDNALDEFLRPSD